MSARAEFNEEEIEGLPFDPEIEIFVGTSYGGDYPFPPLNRIDDCFMTNWKAPKLREGWGRFKSYYEIEWYYAGYHFIDTSRSLVKMLYRVCEGKNEGRSIMDIKSPYSLSISFDFPTPVSEVRNCLSEKTAYLSGYPSSAYFFASLAVEESVSYTSSCITLPSCSRIDITFFIEALSFPLIILKSDL